MSVHPDTNVRPRPKDDDKENGSNKVRVIARIRPLAKYEVQNGSQAVVTKVPGNGNNSECLQVLETNNKNRWFELDAVLDETSNQKEVYEKSGAQKAITQDLFQGYNATILAYGQTGSGKTFTMGTSASATNQGVIPRACEDLFANVKIKCDHQAQVTCSYMEVYNEEIRDLLVDTQTQQLRIRETLDGQIYVRGLTERTIASPQDVYTIMQEANQRRVVASTKMNAASSRSHAICVLKLKGVVATDDKVSKTFESKLTLVDLAGSERLKKTQAKGSRAKEGISINKGLFILGQVVSALSEKGQKKKKSLPTTKPPYRDSKLTRLLQDSLGGNSRTIMIACVSPADFNLEETINTLRYATQARNISNTTTANLVETISQPEARKLRRENALLKAQIQELEATITKLTQDVTPDDLERSISLIQQEQEKWNIPETIQGNSTGDNKDVPISKIIEDNTDTEKTKSNNSNNNIALEDHFHRSQHNSSKESDNNNDEDKDSVSLLVDDVFANPSPYRGMKPRVRRRISGGNVSIASSRASVSSSRASVNSVRTIEEVEEENFELEARLRQAEKDVRATARETAVELPKLKKRVRQLEDSLSESKWFEKETRKLRKQLGEAKADKESAQKAAQQLTNFMEQQKQQTGFRGDEFKLERVNYARHKLNEDWVRFVVLVLNSFKEEMRVLADYFQMVIQVVESPDILDMLGMLNNRERKGGFNAGFGWWKSEEQKEKELLAVSEEKELRSTLLREHIHFFNERLVEVEDKVNLRSESVDVVLESLYVSRARMEANFESQDEIDSMRDFYSKKGEKLLSRLTGYMTEELSAS